MRRVCVAIHRSVVARVNVWLLAVAVGVFREAEGSAHAVNGIASLALDIDRALSGVSRLNY